MRNRLNWAGRVERMKDERLTNSADAIRMEGRKTKKNRDGAGRTT